MHCAPHTHNTRLAIFEIVPPVEVKNVVRWWRRLSSCGSEGVESQLRLQRDAAGVGVWGLRNSCHSCMMATMRVMTSLYNKGALWHTPQFISQM